MLANLVFSCTRQIGMLVLIKKFILGDCMDFSTALCLGGIVLAYLLTWGLLLKSKKIINTIDKEELHEAREIVQKLKL
jgi:hypothetical protein